MKVINYCVCCNSNNIEIDQTFLSKFVFERMTNTKHDVDFIYCGYIHCFDCDYRGSQIRFSPEEESRFYKNYMIGEYVDHRCSIEGEWIRRVADEQHSEQYFQTRRDSIKAALEKVLILSNINSILDYGGNEGEMFPLDLLHAKRYVVDVEVRKLPNGVIGVSSPSQSGLVDVVVCTHTLEHASDPNKMMIDIKSYLKPNGWLYVEVPYGEEHTYKSNGIHEHINHFSEKSLMNRFQTFGFTDIQYFIVDRYSQGIIGRLV